MTNMGATALLQYAPIFLRKKNKAGGIIQPALNRASITSSETFIVLAIRVYSLAHIRRLTASCGLVDGILSMYQENTPELPEMFS